MNCEFIVELSKLRKQSMESVENISGIDRFNRYMHVVRPIENELKDLLRHIKGTDQKFLVLLCGSAGDGKSHLLTYLKHVDDENLLEDFELYNDATESKSPTMTSIETLAEALRAFDDVHLHNAGDKKMILAMNLGTLSNFIESATSKGYTELKKYVESSHIFSGSLGSAEYVENSAFQYVSFSDYQPFTLSENGVQTEYLQALFEKIFVANFENPFYISSQKCNECTLQKKCPVKHNYEFVAKKNVQHQVINKIVEVIIKDKLLASTRDILNFVYDILVHPDFSEKNISMSAANEYENLTRYMEYSTPALMYEYADISPLMDAVRSHDLLGIRSEEFDHKATRFRAAVDITDNVNQALDKTPYREKSNEYDLSAINSAQSNLKNTLFKFICRVEFLTIEQNLMEIHDFAKLLYYQNVGQEKKLEPLYKTIKKDIFAWEGLFPENLICIDNTSEDFYVLEELFIKPFPSPMPEVDRTEIVRFHPTIKICFRKDASSEENAEISLDYNLYKLFIKMSEGYRPTVQDKNLHTDFVSFIDQLAQFGEKNNKIIFLQKGLPSSPQMRIQEGEFDDEYEFKVIR